MSLPAGIGQWSVVIDYVADQGWEATLFLTDDGSADWHYESTDPHTLMSAIGRDLATLVQEIS